MYEQFGKRLFDIVSSGLAIVVLSPLMLLTAILIWAEDRGPAIFRQKRVGRGGNEFTVMKFRSMPVNSPNVASAEAKKIQPTKVGKVIRRLNIDELPQLFNIFMGDMSVVGFRPALARQEDLCQMRSDRGVHRVSPGLTGLAQVNSYDNMPELEKAEWDGKYASRVTFGGDIKIILRTFLYILKRPPTY